MKTQTRFSALAAGAAFITIAAGCSGSDSNRDQCVRTLCGCWEPATLVLDAKVVTGSGQSAPGIKVTCKGETEPTATTGDDGRFRVEIATNESPGCGFERCNTVVFTDPAGTLPTIEQTSFEVKKTGEVRMARPDGGI